MNSEYQDAAEAAGMDVDDEVISACESVSSVIDDIGYVGLVESAIICLMTRDEPMRHHDAARCIARVAKSFAQQVKP